MEQWTEKLMSIKMFTMRVLFIQVYEAVFMRFLQLTGQSKSR